MTHKFSMKCRPCCLIMTDNKYLELCKVYISIVWWKYKTLELSCY